MLRPSTIFFALCAVVVLLIAPLQAGAQGAVAAGSGTFNPVADTYVDAGQPASNFGTSSTVRTDASPVRTSYLRFNVQGVGTVPSATLRVWVQNTDAQGVQVRGVSDNTWGETTTTANNAPGFGAVVDSGAVQAGQWHNYDVSSLVTGDGLVSFALTSVSNTAISLGSRESANAPQLVIPSPPTSSPYLVTYNGSTYQAQSQTTGNTFTGTLKSVVESAVHEMNQLGGGTVTFSAGTFDLGAEYFKPENISHITFQGQGIDTTIVRNSSSAAADTEPFNFSGANFVTIRDLTVSAGGPLRTTSDAIDFDFGNNSTIERVKITAARGRGIVFDGKNAGWFSANNVVRDCVITGAIQSDGIELLASTNNLIEGCTISNVAGHGIQMAKSSTSAPQPNKKSSDNIIRNNVIDNSGQDGINFNGGDRNRVEGNQITNSANISSSRDGIRIGTGDNVSCNDTVVANNTATDNQATKTQRYGLAITSALCNRTVVGTNNFNGNKTGPILDQGTNTQYTGADTQPPTTPTGVSASAISSSLVRVTWNASTDNVAVTGYRIYRNGSSTPVGTVGGGTLTFDDTTVAPSTTYTYKVDAIDAVPNASPQSTASAPVTTPAAPDTQPPTTPTNVVANAISHALVRVTWNASTDNVAVTGYRIYRNGGSTPVGTVGGGTLTFDDTTVAPSTTYTYKVDAIDAVPNASPQSTASAPVTTPAAPPDSQAPTTPTNVVANAISHALVRVTWNASTDNVAVTGYRIYRNGGSTPVGTVGGTALTFDDTTVAPSTTYTYKVDAIDAVPNASPQSTASAPVTTPAAPSSLTFNPSADSYVNESSPGTNYGTSTQVRIDGSPVNRAYLRFTVQGVVGTITSAKLRIYANSASSVGHQVSGVADNTWGETTITFTGAPAVGSVVGSSGPFSAGSWIEVDVTSLITGNGTYSLALTTPSSTAISYASREASNRPELVLQLG